MKLRTTLKIATATSVILLCIGVAISLYFRLSVTERAEDFELYTLVPADSKLIVDTDNVSNLMLRINELNCSKDNHFLYFSHFFSYLKEHISTLLEHTPHGLSKQMNKMLISFHAPDNDRNQVFYCRLGAGDYEFIEDFINKNFASSFPSRSFNYRGEEIRIYPMPDDTFLSCYVTKEFLVVSYQKKLIEQVIDTRLTKKSILSDNTFAEMRTAHRMVSPATIYARMQAVDMGKGEKEKRCYANLGDWTEFNLGLNGEVIYLSGISHEVDSSANFVNMIRAQEAMDEFPGDILPASTFFFAQASISDLGSVLDFTTHHVCAEAVEEAVVAKSNEKINDFLRDCAGAAVTTCMFHYDDTLSGVPHTIASIPVHNTSRARRQLANLYRSAPRSEMVDLMSKVVYFTTPTLYTCYALPRNTLLPRMVAMPDLALQMYACLYREQLLLSPNVAGLKAYIELMDQEKSLASMSSYEYVTTSLSQNYNYMIMADMEEVFEQPEGYVHTIPHLFFQHSDFFSKFMLTAQFSCIDDVVYPTVILFYKEDGTDSVEEVAV